MKIRASLLASAIGLLCVGISAAAEPPIGSRVGERIEREDIKKQRNAAVYAHELARCIVAKQARTAKAFLGTTDAAEGNRLRREMDGEHECFNMTEGNDFVEGRAITFPVTSSAECWRSGRLRAMNAHLRCCQRSRGS